MKIFFSKRAEKYLASIPTRIAMHILDKIQEIPEGDIKPPSGRKGEYRLRAGKYRILFYIESENLYIVKIDTRGDVYRH